MQLWLDGKRPDASRRWYRTDETRAALDMIRADHVSPDQPGLFAPLLDTLLARGDCYMLTGCGLTDACAQ